MRTRILTSVFATWAIGSAALADDVEALDTGWYDDMGTHTVANSNYFVGRTSDTEFRNFFVFDLTDVEGTIVEASLRIYNPVDGFRSDEGVETYQVRAVTTDVETLVSGAGGVAAFDDLGTGTLFGEVNALIRDIDQTITVPLNEDGIAALNAAEGLVALGGVLPNIVDSDSLLEILFGFTNGATTALARVVYRTDSDPISASAVGLRSAAVLCENLTDPQTVVVPRPEVFELFSVNCEEAGLVASTGDEIRIVISGIANSTSSWLNGFVTGVEVADPINCFNVTQSDFVGWTQDSGIWDCRRAPFTYALNDEIRVMIRGVAE
ncbi:MAG: hypothetical protein AAFX85_09350 [Pseudomonadota bacterium]